MSLDYLLNMKSKNDYVCAYLKEIKNNYTNMKEVTLFNLIDKSITTNNNYYQYNKTISEINELLNQHSEHISQLVFLNEKLTQKIVSLCKHEWIEDSIDIDPDRSKTIEYCKICGVSSL
jgi:type VI protein secretion system component Hcp